MKPNSKNIKEVYDKIAEGFYHTRQHPLTPELTKISKIWKPGKLLDIGCGHANSTLPFAQAGFSCHAIDISTKMLKLAKQYTKKHGAKIVFKKGDLLKITFKEKFDYIISIAVLHHLDSEEKRLKALKEIKRLLKPKGKFFLTVWNQPELYGTDDYVEWKTREKIYQRYYHFFSKKELKDLFKKIGLKAKIYEDDSKKNICILGGL